MLHCSFETVTSSCERKTDAPHSLTQLSYNCSALTLRHAARLFPYHLHSDGYDCAYIEDSMQNYCISFFVYMQFQQYCAGPFIYYIVLFYEK